MNARLYSVWAGSLIAASVLAVSTFAESPKVAGDGDRSESAKVNSLQKIADECHASAKDGAAGFVVISRPTTFANEQAEITVPCRISLESEIVRFRNVELLSRHLILDNGALGQSVDVSFVSSTLTGAGDSGLLLDLVTSSDGLSLRNTSISYSSSVWLRVVDDRSDEGGEISVVRSSLSSMGKRSDGVLLLVGQGNGSVMMNNVDIETSDDTGGLIVGGSCKVTRVRGAIFVCPTTEG